jgi:Tol biopolymer transport system component
MHSPTVTAGRTVDGALLGTAAYMSPEQAQGKHVDRRADIWAFGVVLFEMLSGQQGFNGGTTVEVLSNVLKTEPDWDALPPATPSGVRLLIRHCLQKDHARRLRDIADARYQIEEALSGPSGTAVLAPAHGSRTRERLLWVAALMIVSAVVGGTAWALRQPQAVSDEVRFEISTPPTTDPASVAVSPDGQTIVFAATADGKSQLWLRSMDALSARPLAATDYASSPFWSPDSRSIGFFANGQLKRIDLDSGSVRGLGIVAGMSGAWNRDGTILLAAGAGAALVRISENGGQLTPVVQSSLQANVIVSSQFLPDDRHFLFQAGGTEPGIYVGQLGPSEAPRRILNAQGGAYASSGHLLFVQRGTLFAQVFDLARLELTGDPTAIAEGILVRESGGAVVSASAAGPIVYRTGSSPLQSHFVWFDRSGKPLETIAGSDIGSGFNSALSLDGHRLAISQNAGGGPADIWLLDLNRGVPRKFTFDKLYDLTPVWSPDGKRIAFSSNRISGNFDLYVKSVDGIRDEELLEKGDAGPPSDWSRDGRFILRARQLGRGNDDIWALRLDGDRKASPVVESPFNEGNGQFSPDGKWIAYQSDESGQKEIYVQPFPGPGQKTVITHGGGVQVRWRDDQRELFYLTHDVRLMAVQIRTDSNGVEVLGKPVPLFRTNPAFLDNME